MHPNPLPLNNNNHFTNNYRVLLSAAPLQYRGVLVPRDRACVEVLGRSGILQKLEMGCCFPYKKIKEPVEQEEGEERTGERIHERVTGSSF